MASHILQVFHDLDGVKVGILKNFLENPLTTTERINLGNTLGIDNVGLGVYDKTLNSKFYWTGTGWVSGTTSTEEYILSETPNGLLDGVNATFTTLNNFVPGYVSVYINGLKLKIIDEYNTVGSNTILLMFSPSSTETILVDYKKA